MANDKDYCDRKERYSIQLQAVCDHKNLFTNYYVGSLGSMHDAQVLHDSSLYAAANEGALFNEKPSQLPSRKNIPTYIFGDSGYPLQPWLIVSFTH